MEDEFRKENVQPVVDRACLRSSSCWISGHTIYSIQGFVGLAAVGSKEEMF